MELQPMVSNHVLPGQYFLGYLCLQDFLTNDVLLVPKETKFLLSNSMFPKGNRPGIIKVRHP